MVDNIQNVINSGVALTPMVILINLAAAFLLSMLVGVCYKLNHKGLSYSQSLVLSFILLSVTTSCVIMVIGNNLARAFGLVGAMSIIRFRTVVKDTKDTTYVFFALAVGMATGISAHTVAVISTAAFIIVDTFLTKTNFGSIRKYEYIIRFIFDPARQTDDAYQDILDKYVAYIHLVSMNVISDSNVEYTYNVRLKKDRELDNFVKDLSKVDGLTGLNVMTAKMDVEY